VTFPVVGCPQYGHTRHSGASPPPHRAHARPAGGAGGGATGYGVPNGGVVAKSIWLGFPVSCQR